MRSGLSMPARAVLALLGPLLCAPASAGPADDDLVQRRAIRGAPVEAVRESEELRQLREFDEATFPRPLPGGAAQDDLSPLPSPSPHPASGGVGPDALP